MCECYIKPSTDLFPAQYMYPIILNVSLARYSIFLKEIYWLFIYASKCFLIDHHCKTLDRIYWFHRKWLNLLSFLQGAWGIMSHCCDGNIQLGFKKLSFHCLFCFCFLHSVHPTFRSHGLTDFWGEISLWSMYPGKLMMFFHLCVCVSPNWKKFHTPLICS